MNLHFIIDNIYSRKFIDFINNNFDGNKDKFILITLCKPKYIDPEKYNNLEVVYYKKELLFQYTKEFRYILKDMDNYEKIFVHYLTDIVAMIILKYDKKIEYNWMLWGADFYCISNINLYQQRTQKFIEKRKENTFDKFKKYIKMKRRIKAIEKIDYILTWNKGDFQIIKSIVKCTAEMKYYFYPSPVDYNLLNDINNNLELEYNLKTKYDYIIQVGNSGDQTNNHFEVLLNLKHIIGDERIGILCPLSYGDKQYIEKLIKVGKEMFGDRFIPLTEYLSVDKYKEILFQVDIAIMNHNRQQGVGNIWSLLYLKKKLYINSDVTTYNTFKELGISLNDTKRLSNISLNELLNFNENEYKINRKIVFDNYNDNVAAQCIKKIMYD